MLKNNFIFLLITIINLIKLTISQLNIKGPNVLLEIFNSKKNNKKINFILFYFR